MHMLHNIIYDLKNIEKRSEKIFAIVRINPENSS